ncbi:hypothetical protein LRS06_22095 [Hymenobacter sp. J193]|uniref:hypothetical protein n=1 Tax=Hymenobacter sp. J193 TaxID=2898429 RepID=UPI0021514B90|nr:hypothetical protein [Hymenobacter sp. J193]MCR5890422.1 hypothetical protein [Hymenobacter sp. J193]
MSEHKGQFVYAGTSLAELVQAHYRLLRDFDLDSEVLDPNSECYCRDLYWGIWYLSFRDRAIGDCYRVSKKENATTLDRMLHAYPSLRQYRTSEPTAVAPLDVERLLAASTDWVESKLAQIQPATALGEQRAAQYRQQVNDCRNLVARVGRNWFVRLV